MSPAVTMVPLAASPAGDLSLAAGLDWLAAGANRTILLRGGTYRMDLPVRLRANLFGTEISSCAGEQARLLVADDVDQPLVTLEGTHGARISHLTFVGRSDAGVGIDVVDGRCNVIVGNHFERIGTAIMLRHARGNRIVGNSVTDVSASGIEAKDASDDNLIADNEIRDVHGPETHGGGIFLHGANNNRISHNRIQATDGMGIGVANWDDTTVSIGNVIEFNTVLDTNRTATDSGAIYLLGRSQADMQMVVAGNVIERTGSPLEHSVGIYLDDSASGVVVTRNLVRQPGSDAAQIHGGSWNEIANNIFDLGQGRSAAVLFQAAPDDTHPSNLQLGNRVERNLILSDNPNPKVFVWLEGGVPLIERNIYVGTVGPAQPGPGAGPLRDQSPVLLNEAPKALSAQDYWLAQRLAAVQAGFVPFTISQAGPRLAPPATVPAPGCDADRP